MVKRKASSGFSLLEVILASAMLGLLTLAIFRAFDYGATAFKKATSRQDSQAALRSVYGLLRDDLRKSHFRTLSTLERSTTQTDQTYRRDALSLASLKDWSAEESFDDINGLPKWDRYYLYYATMEGLLIRTTIDHDRPDYSPVPFFDLDEDRYLKEDPAFNSGYQTSYRVLSRKLLEFRGDLDPARDVVEVRCVLQNESEKRNEIALTVYPQNTWPKGDNR